MVCLFGHGSRMKIEMMLSDLECYIVMPTLQTSLAVRRAALTKLWGIALVSHLHCAVLFKLRFAKKR